MAIDRMPLCVLHIGSEKTGTTSIQRYFSDNRTAHLREGFLYPRSAAYPGDHVHRKLSDAVRAGQNLEGLRLAGRFEKECARAAENGAKVVILSSEFFHSHIRNADAIGRFHDFLARRFEQIRVV
jgi:hypothetical protein